MTTARRSISMVAATAAVGALAPLAPATAQVELSHQVAPGQTLGQIAERFNVPAASIAKRNGLNLTDVVRAGSFLSIPSAPAKPAEHVVKSGENLTSIARTHKTTVAELVSINKIDNPHRIYVGQKLKLTGAPATPAKPAEKKAAPAPASGTYTVKSGDNLSRIAQVHKTSVSALMKANNLSSTLIFPGQKLSLPGSTAPASTPAKPANKKAAPAPANGTYTVKSGDNLSTIASRNKTTVAAIRSANNLSSNLIYPGQKLTIPGATASSAPAPKAQSTNQNLVPSTFLHYTYPEATVRSANENKAYLNSISVPSRGEMQALVRQTALQYGVDPALAQAHAFRESGFDARAVSPANAIGVMQVIPSSGEWASQMAGRKLNLLDPNDNVVAGILIIRQLQSSAGSLEAGIAGYYQGLGSVRKYGMYSDTKDYVAKIKASMAQFR